MKRLSLKLGLVYFLLSAPLLQALSTYSVDTGECGGEPILQPSISKTPVKSNKSESVKFYGQLEFRRSAEDAKSEHCHVTARLMIGMTDEAFREAKHVEWDTENGEIAGIDLVGFSPDESKFAADFWLAEGDGKTHNPVIYDLPSRTTAYRSLGDLIQKIIHGCDQNEDFLGVTNSAEAIIAIPPSEYSDTPDCGDKGLWHFNLKTGRVYRVKRISGIHWK